jgi:hypothetical protein
MTLRNRHGDVDSSVIDARYFSAWVVRRGHQYVTACRRRIVIWVAANAIEIDRSNMAMIDAKKSQAL